MISQPERWHAISRHALGGTQHVLFIDKLINEQGWEKRFAEQAAGEYLRFCYLACISPTPVSPSKAVDAVWHLHLTFSRDYWQCFCPDALGRALHHEPSDSNDSLLMQQQYQATLALYEAEFDTPAPAAIWGNRQAGATTRAGWAWLVAPLALFGTGAAIAANDAAYFDVKLLLALGALALLILFIWWLFQPRRIKRRKDNKDGGSGCSSCSSGASCGSSCGGGGD